MGKESTRNAGDLGSIPGSGRSPGGGHGNPLQYSCLENPMDKRSLVAELDTTEAAERIRTSLLEACSSGLVMRRGEGCVVAAPLWERGGPGEEGSAGEWGECQIPQRPVPGTRLELQFPPEKDVCEKART